MQLETQLCRTWGSTSLAPHHAALSSDGYIHQGTGLVNLKITRRGQIPPAVKQSAVAVMPIGTMEEPLFLLQPGPCLHCVRVHPEDGSQLLSFMQFYC